MSTTTKNGTSSDRSPDRFLELRNIHKRFGGVHALRGIDLTIDLGQAYHLLGENGCGKSTVIKIMSGAHAPSEGEIILDGKTYTSLNPIQSLAAGIETVYQDLSLIPNLTVAENVALNEQLVEGNGRLFRSVKLSQLRETAERALSTVGLPTDKAFLNTIVSELPLAMRQLVAISRAIATRAKLVIMDEPTTSLTRREVDNLIEVVERLRAERVAVLFVTHKLDECYRIGGNAVVFRDGQCVAQGPIENYTKKQLSELMIGREIDAERYRTAQPGDAELLKLDGLTASGFKHIGFTLRKVKSSALPALQIPDATSWPWQSPALYLLIEVQSASKVRRPKLKARRKPSSMALAMCRKTALQKAFSSINRSFKTRSL